MSRAAGEPLAVRVAGRGLPGTACLGYRNIPVALQAVFTADT